MATDGTIDYRGYTRKQLAEARETIDAARYPHNHARLLEELTARDAGTSPERGAAAGAAGEVTVLQPEFRGDPREYFRARSRACRSAVPRCRSSAATRASTSASGSSTSR